jgi:hypothetical protein
MRKGLIVLLMAVVAVAFALPAKADMTPTNLNVSGFYRSHGWLSNFHSGAPAAPKLATDNASDHAQTFSYVEQRFRVKFDFGTENVKAVWFLESDNIWGDTAGGAQTNLGGTSTTTNTLGAQRNSGGALGADRINTETKNVYVWFKVPDHSTEFTVGLQNQSDDYAGILFGGADMAGIFVTGKMEPASYKLGFAKLYENATQRTDDQTLYTASVKFSPVKEVKLGLNFYYLQDDTGKVAGAVGAVLPLAVTAPNQFKAKVYMPGVDATFQAGPATISAFALYQFGKKADYLVDNVSTRPDIDINAFMLDARADLNLGPGKFFAEALYMSGGDDPTNKYKAPITLATREASPGGNSAYSRTNMEILLSSPDTINVSQCIIGCSGGFYSSDPGNGGRGITHVAAGYQQLLTPKVTARFNAGYMASSKSLKTDNNNVGGTGRTSKYMATEVNARIDYNIAKGLDVGVVGAYAFLGDGVHAAPTAGGVKTADWKDPWTSYARINYAF